MSERKPRFMLTRRTLLGGIVALGAEAGARASQIGDARQPMPAAGGEADYWWHRYPSLVQTDRPEIFQQSQARMVIHGMAKDPTWGPYAQRLSELEDGAAFRKIKEQGGRVITWIEGFGDCMLYVVALERNPDGTFVARKDDPRVTEVKRSHWNWADPHLPKGNTFRWVGQHNLVNREDFVAPLLQDLKNLPPVPIYPDGKPAVGHLPGARYPLDAQVYDACGAKDINGELHPSCELPEHVNEIDPATGMPHGPMEGLYPAVLGKDDVPAVPGRKPGETVYCGVMSVHKDLSAPYWQAYVRSSIRELVKLGLDGVWCDNYSPWDNFGYPPVQKAFGDWSVARFHRALRADPTILPKEAAPDLTRFDVRQALMARAQEFGAKNPASYDDPAWKDVRWRDDPVWNAFKAFRQLSAQEDLQGFYQAIHAEAEQGGRPDFCIGGNDVPLFGLGWVRDAWQDMINTETTPGWHMGSGSRGIMIPPLGKMAVLYRAALEHQKGPFSNAWYYLNGGYEKYRQKPEIGKVLAAEAFAHGAFLLCMPDNKTVAGTLESHAWWNRFVRDNEQAFGQRTPVAEVGVLFSPDNQLFLLAPGGFPNLDHQPHIFGHHGWATALIDAHRPYRTLTDWKLTAEHLKPLHTFIVPDAECLEEPAVSALAGWVRGGGRLIVTGPSGMREGPLGLFRTGRVSRLATALKVTMPTQSGVMLEKAVGKGHVVWTPDPVGMDYYLHHTERSKRLPALMQLVGNSQVVQTEDLPATVGLSLWQNKRNQALTIDLNNYALDADTDSIHPAENLTFRIRVPDNGKMLRITTLTPDSIPPATMALDGGWATVRLQRLEHYAAILLQS